MAARLEVIELMAIATIVTKHMAITLMAIVRYEEFRLAVKKQLASEYFVVIGIKALAKDFN